MATLKTLTGIDIPEEARGLLYLGEYDYEKRTLEITSAKFYKDPYYALEDYVNIPNPPSHVATGETREEFIKEVERLHKWLTNDDYIYDLYNYL